MCNTHLKLEDHPRLMALICTAVGVAGIGLILTVAFASSEVMLGVGIALGVIGVAGTILGCLQLNTVSALSDVSKKHDGDGVASSDPNAPGAGAGVKSIAPNKVPSPYEVSKGKIRGVDDDASPSPTRVPPDTHNSPEASSYIIDMMNNPNNTRWGGPMNTSSPARGVLPPGSTSMYSSSNGSQQQQLRQQITPGTIFASTHRATDGAGVGPRAFSQASSSDAAGGPMVLSPFEKRSYPVPAALFPAPVPGASISNASTGTAAYHNNINSNMNSNRSTTYEMDSGVRGGNGYDHRTAQEQIRQNQDELDALARYREGISTQSGRNGFIGGARSGSSPSAAGADDEDALPKGFWQDRRRQ